MSDISFEKPVTPSLSPLKWRRAWLSMDQNQSAIEFAKSKAGIITLHLAFAAVLAASGQFSNSALGLIALTLFGIAAFPAKRMAIMVGASLFYIVMRPFRVDGWSAVLEYKSSGLGFAISPLQLQIVAVVSFMAFAFMFLKAMNWQKSGFIAKRPVVSLALIWALTWTGAMLVPDQTLLDAYLWTFAGVMISSIWILAYAAVDEKSRDTTHVAARGGMMRPFWGGSATPIGKSFGYLNKFDAKNEDELAVTRLKAIKLVVWALILTGLMQVMEYVARDMHALPILQDTILAHADGKAYSGATNWASLIYNYFIDLVVISIWGHFIVAVVRMVGYRIPRNTRNPLAARTLADFWNRYFFYFKELLVDFFFYPTFVRYFKKQPKLRIAFATFCAAGLGNFFYHFARDTFQFADQSFFEALAVFQSAAFYSVLLAAGLIISQINPIKPKPADGFIRYEILTRFNVFAFFCFVKIFDDISGQGSIAERAAFATDLFRF